MPDIAKRTYSTGHCEIHCDVGRLPVVQVVLSLIEDQRLHVVCLTAGAGDFTQDVDSEDTRGISVHVVVEGETDTAVVINDGGAQTEER